LDGTAQKDSLRGLKALVIGMGVLIVLGTALVIGLVIKRFYDAGGGGGEAAGRGVHRVSPPAPLAIRIPSPRGAAIGGMTSLDGRLAIWVKDDAGGRIVMIDPRSGTVSGTVTLSAP
jgi:hypothetical protein